jgi:HEAT repeat protein
MKVRPRFGRLKFFKVWTAVAIFGLIAGVITPVSLSAIGCFVLPESVADQSQPINEPAQRAIIVYNAGREDLILQVKCDGPAEEFGWLIPVPGLPTVQPAAMECFYELSRYTQELWEPRYIWVTSTNLENDDIKKRVPVIVVEVKTIGAYEVTVLSTKNTSALGDWLKANGFALPRRKTGAIDACIQSQGYFVAVKVNLDQADGFKLLEAAPNATADSRSDVKPKPANGELPPLHLSFGSARCVLPLSLSSLNGAPSKVQVYVLSSEPLVEKKKFEQKLAEVCRQRLAAQASIRSYWEDRRRESLEYGRRLASEMSKSGQRPPTLTTNMPSLTVPDRLLRQATLGHLKELLRYTRVSGNEFSECSQRIPSLQNQNWWLAKQTWTFSPEEMRDLEFEPAIPVFVENLADAEGCFAAANLLQLGSNGVSAVLAALESTNPAVRGHAASVLPELTRAPEPVSSLTPDVTQGGRDERAVRLLPALLKDPEPQVRYYAVQAVRNCADPDLMAAMPALMRDGNEEVASVAASCLGRDQAGAAKHIPVLLAMVKEPNPGLQTLALEALLALKATVPREDLLSLLGNPEAAGLACQQLMRGPFSGEEALPLLHSSAWSSRFKGIMVLRRNANKESVELALPLLKDPEELIRARAYDLLCDLTGQDIPMDQPENWEKWWKENAATFVPKPLPKRQGRPAWIPSDR